MEDKIKVLFYNRDSAGVSYYRTQTPAMQLERDHSDKFHIELSNSLDFSKPETIEFLKSFHIINYHRTLIDNIVEMKKLYKTLKEADITLIADIDDYWELDKSHPFYMTSKKSGFKNVILENLRMADYVTTTTDLFAEEIRKVTGKDNVLVFPNSIDPSWMKQFQDNRKPDPNGLVRITYMGGSSHRADVEQLQGVVNILNADVRTKGKFKMIVAGWDTQGTTKDITFNQDFGTELRKRGLWTKKIVTAINKSDGNVDLIPDLPIDLVEKYRNKIFDVSERPINSVESVYLQYEKILTDNYNIIKDERYIKWLTNYERNTYSNEGTYARRWTEKANIYAKVLDETDISLAPLANHSFNKMKSNLKQVECWTRKIPIVCTDIPPYNVDGVDGRNCFLIPDKKRNYQDWAKALKKLILNADLRKEMGENLYNDFKEKYNLSVVTKKRAEFYSSVVMENLKVA